RGRAGPGRARGAGAGRHRLRRLGRGRGAGRGPAADPARLVCAFLEGRRPTGRRLHGHGLAGLIWSLSPMETVKSHVVHGGTLRYLRHDGATTGTPMTLSVVVPAGEGPFPVLIWLSGLTCTEDNFTTKAGAYKAAAEHGVIIVAPDTSPRGEGVADDPAYDLG